MVSRSVCEYNLGDAVAGVAVGDDDVVVVDVVIDAALPLLHTALRRQLPVVADTAEVGQPGRGEDHAVRGAPAVPPRPLPLHVGGVVHVAR